MHFLINVAACLGKQAQKSALSECSCVCECSGWRVYVSRHCLRRYVAAHFSRRFVNFRLSFIHSDILHTNTRSVLASVYTILCFHLLSLRFNGHFPGEPGLAGVHWSKGCDDNWSYKSCKAPVNNHHQQTNTQFFYRSDAFPVAQQTMSKHWRENITFHGLAYPKLTWGSSNFSLWPLIAPGYLGGGLPCLSSALWCQCFHLVFYENCILPSVLWHLVGRHCRRGIWPVQ